MRRSWRRGTRGSRGARCHTPTGRPTRTCRSCCYGSDAYLQSLRQLSAIVTGAEKRKAFVDGDDVCVIYDLKTTSVPSSRTCEWYRVRDEKIAAVSVVFDARPFAALFEAQPGH